MRFFSKKKIVILGIVILGLVVLYFLIPQAYYYYQSWKIGQTYKEFEESFLEYLRADTFGGKTPQETYEMYLEALKQGDLELASKYYWWERQVKEKERLEKLAEEGKLQDYIDSFPDWAELKEEEYWDPDGRRYSWIEILEEPIKIKLPLGGGEYQEDVLEPGEYKQEIIFHLNKHANIWKLY